MFGRVVVVELRSVGEVAPRPSGDDDGLYF
jgi:hypothetical protein